MKQKQVKMIYSKFIQLILVLLLTVIKESQQQCLFPIEIKGEYIFQSTVLNGNSVRYSHINITDDSIPIWGQCYKRLGHNVILQISIDEISCFRCFNLKLVAKNVLLIHTINEFSNCLTNEEKVECPTDDSSINDEKKFTEMILYRTKTWEQLQPKLEFCPFSHGKIKFNYILNENPICSNYESEMNFCPSGSAMNVHYRSCENDHHVVYECLGNWEYAGKNYVALIENTPNNQKPIYRCAVYTYNTPNNMSLTMQISNDSMCSSIKPKTHRTPPQMYTVPNTDNKKVFQMRIHEHNFERNSESLSIEFPEWLQGDWEYLQIRNNSLTFRDHSSYKIFFMALRNPYSNEKFIVQSRTQCGENENSFKCIWIKKLHHNVLDFQVGSQTINNLNTYDICNNEYFDGNRWLTQSRIDNNLVPTKCPIIGHYSGIVPDNLDLCSTISSDCDKPDVMYFQVGPCTDDFIYEKRTYQCLGEWFDEKNVLYTYTKRVDTVGSFECFVGAEAGFGAKKIFVKEAGESCHKNINPWDFGMEMNQLKECPSNNIPEKPTMKDPQTKYITFTFDSNDILTTTTPDSAIPKRKTTSAPIQIDVDETNEISDSTYSSSSQSISLTVYLLSFLSVFTLFRFSVGWLNMR